MFAYFVNDLLLHCRKNNLARIQLALVICGLEGNKNRWEKVGNNFFWEINFNYYTESKIYFTPLSYEKKFVIFLPPLIYAAKELACQKYVL